MQKQKKKQNQHCLNPVIGGKMDDFPWQRLNKALDLEKNVIQRNALTEPIKKNHNPINQLPKIEAQMFQQIARGNIKLQALKLGNHDLTIQQGDGIGIKIDGARCSPGADILLQNHPKNLQIEAQLKFGQTPQNTNKMANEHMKKYPDIQVYGPKGHEGPNVKTNIEFDGIKAQMPTRDEITNYLEANKQLIQKYGLIYQTAQKNLKAINLDINRVQKNIDSFTNNGKDTTMLMEKLAELNVKKQNLVIQRDEAIQKISNSQNKYFNRSQFDWKKSLYEGAKFGAIVGAAQGLLLSILQIMKRFQKGDVSFSECLGVLVKQVGISASFGGIIGGVQMWGVEMSKYALSSAGKNLGLLSANAGIIVSAIFYLTTIVSVLSVADKHETSEIALHLVYKTALFATSLGGCILIGSSVGGPLGIALGFTFGMVIGVLDYYFGHQLQQNNISLFEMEKFMYSIHGYKTKAFGIPELQLKSNQIQGLPKTKLTSDNVVGLPKTKFSTKNITGIPKFKNG